MNPCYKNLVCSLIIILQGCSGASVAPVVNRGEVKEIKPTSTQRGITAQLKFLPKAKLTRKKNTGCHAVGRGDTLYSIAWRHDYDYKDVASWNKIVAPYTIYLGQEICLKAIVENKSAIKGAKSSVKNKLASQTKLPNEITPKKVFKKQNIISKRNKFKATISKDPIKWLWPAQGKLAKSNSPTSKKGIDIAGKPGQRIRAAAAGDVVYSGSGLLGYGKLIIIKHSETYLSAYAYNSKILVKEGDSVNASQEISEMGQDHTGRTVLHFEIRKNGKPVRPTKYLPK